MRPYLVRYRPPPPSHSFRFTRFLSPLSLFVRVTPLHPRSYVLLVLPRLSLRRGLTLVGADATTASDSICRNKIISLDCDAVACKSRSTLRRVPSPSLIFFFPYSFSGKPGNIFRKIAVAPVSFKNSENKQASVNTVYSNRLNIDLSKIFFRLLADVIWFIEASSRGSGT